MQFYDIIGDIHGHADVLRRLLAELDYTEVDGVFRHESKRIIFVGDFIDRGPGQREVLRIARNMCDAGTAMAVLGNHEFNAIGWATSDGKGGFLREHTEDNLRQHNEFIRQVGDGTPEYRGALKWFQSLPVWLDLPGIRVVHACWHGSSREDLKSCLDDNYCFTEEGFKAANTRGSKHYQAAEILLKGPEERLPKGMFFVDKDGKKREEVRIKWWDQAATTFSKAAINWDSKNGVLPDSALPVDYSYRGSQTVFFGHYWMTEKPTLTASNAACLDFSVAKRGYLTAYRWSGERILQSNSLFHVPAENP